VVMVTRYSIAGSFPARGTTVRSAKKFNYPNGQ
jgi:hypothetical protein